MSDFDELAHNIVKSKDLGRKLNEAIRLATTEGKGKTHDEWWSAMQTLWELGDHEWHQEFISECLPGPDGDELAEDELTWFRAGGGKTS
jgi:hypothetical protein